MWGQMMAEFTGSQAGQTLLILHCTEAEAVWLPGKRGGLLRRPPRDKSQSCSLGPATCPPRLCPHLHPHLHNWTAVAPAWHCTKLPGEPTLSGRCPVPWLTLLHSGSF